MELIPNKEQISHHNPSLAEYEIYGSPYGKTKPASLLFRLSILCGWRKAEALTCPTRPVTDASLSKLANLLSKISNFAKSVPILPKMLSATWWWISL